MPDETSGNGAAVGKESAERRSFLSFLSLSVMLTGLVAGYGAFAAYVGRFLFPTGKNAYSTASNRMHGRPSIKTPTNRLSGKK